MSESVKEKHDDEQARTIVPAWWWEAGEAARRGTVAEVRGVHRDVDVPGHAAVSWRRSTGWITTIRSIDGEARFDALTAAVPPQDQERRSRPSWRTPAPRSSG